MSQELVGKKNNIKTAIDIYTERIIQPLLSDIKRSLIFQIIFFAILVTFTIITNLQPNLSTIIGTLGFIGSGVTLDWDKLKTVISTLQNDRHTLRKSIAILLIEFTLANNDMNRLNDVEDSLRKLFNSKS